MPRAFLYLVDGDSSDGGWRQRSWWWEETVYVEDTAEIADVFIVLPVCAVNQLEGKWRRRRANEPKRAMLAPGGNRRAGTKLLEFLFFVRSFPGSPSLSSSSSAHVQRRLLVVSPSPGVIYTHMHNSLERTAPGHAGFRPVEFLDHRFLRHYILPRLFFLGFAPQWGRRWDRDCRAPGVNGWGRWIQTRHT